MLVVMLVFLGMLVVMLIFLRMLALVGILGVLGAGVRCRGLRLGDARMRFVVRGIVLGNQLSAGFGRGGLCETCCGKGRQEGCDNN